jgi:hypothetical protein
VPTTLWGASPLLDSVVYPNVTVNENSFDVKAGPLWNQADAESKCPDLCIANHGVWNTAWDAIQLNVMSVCGCYLSP